MTPAIERLKAAVAHSPKGVLGPTGQKGMAEVRPADVCEAAAAVPSPSQVVYDLAQGSSHPMARAARTVGCHADDIHHLIEQAEAALGGKGG